MRTDRNEVRDRLDELVGAGELSSTQADAVAGALDDGRHGGVPPLVEAAGYVGAALSAVGLLLIGDRFWDDLEYWAQTLVLLVLAGGLLAGGFWIRPVAASSTAADRLSGTLWLLATLAWTGAVAVVVEAFAVDVDFRPLLLGAAGLAVGGGLWRLRPAGLQLVVMFASTMTTACGVFLLLEPDAAWAWATLVTGIGLAWSALVWGGLLRPERIGYLLGAAAALVGPEIAAWDAPIAAPVAGLAIAVGVVVANSRAVGLASLTAVGTLAATAYLLRLAGQVMPDEVGWTLGLLGAGALLLVVSLSTMRTARGDVPGQAQDGR